MFWCVCANSQNLITNGGFNYFLEADSANEGDCLTGHTPILWLDTTLRNWYPWTIAALHSNTNCNRYASMGEWGLIQGKIAPHLPHTMYWLEFDYYGQALTKKARLHIVFNDTLIDLSPLFPDNIPLIKKQVLVSPLSIKLKPNAVRWQRKKLMVVSNEVLRSIHFELENKPRKKDWKPSVFIDNISLKPVTFKELMDSQPSEDIEPDAVSTLKAPDNSILIINETERTYKSNNVNKQEQPTAISKYFKHIIKFKNEEMLKQNSFFIQEMDNSVKLYRLTK